MDIKRTLALQAQQRERVRTVLQGVALVALLGLAAVSAIIIKRAQYSAPVPPLAAVDDAAQSPDAATDGAEARFDPNFLPLPVFDPLNEVAAESATEATASPTDVDSGYPADTRWFDGRPMRPSKTITMTVTGYSPGEESCGDSADGITSSLHSVWTNGMKLVAADTRVLPLGSVVSVPGYHGAQLVPVLDRGGKIKGNRLDLLYPTADQARQWGVKKVTITVWEYVDGKPAPDWRKIRDSKPQ